MLVWARGIIVVPDCFFFFHVWCRVGGDKGWSNK